MKKKQTSAKVDRQILAGREAGMTLAEIGTKLGMTRQGVHTRLKALAAEGRGHPWICIWRRKRQVIRDGLTTTGSS